MDNLDELYSYHVFLFPFQWENCGKGFAEALLEDKCSLGPFTGSLPLSVWKRTGFDVNSRLKYNEANYFYDFVRDILYDRRAPASCSQPGDEDAFLAHFEYNLAPDTQHYIIKPPDKEYRLLIDSIILHLYSTGVGVLSFHLNNRNSEQKEPEDILRINQYGRRLYPPYFGIPGDMIGTAGQFLPGGFMEGLEMVKNSELSQEIGITGEASEDFMKYAASGNFGRGIFNLPAFISRLFRGVPLTTETCDHMDGLKIKISPVMDDRMFVVCWYGNDHLTNELESQWKKNIIDTNVINEDLPDRLDWFYKYLFVDAYSRTCRNTLMAKDLLRKHTNDRWLDYGAFFGVSRYSFVCLTPELTTLRKNDAAFLVNHMQTMYYKLVELCLVQRACILKFSDEVTDISGLIRVNEKKLPDKVGSLYKQYIRFVNKIYFREVTAQEQGIELYDLLQKHMKLNEQVKDLDAEISELHGYVNLKEQRNESRIITRLTRLSAIFLPAALVAGIFGMNVFDKSSLYLAVRWPFWISMFSIVMSSLIVWIVFIPRSRNKKTYNTWKTTDDF